MFIASVSILSTVKVKVLFYIALQVTHFIRREEVIEREKKQENVA